MKTQELLNEIKNNEIAYAIVNQNGEVYCNKETMNIMDIYGYNENGVHFYGVYGDIVGINQIDSRKNTDAEIEKAIEKMLENGTPVKRSELPNNFERTFYWGN